MRLIGLHSLMLVLKHVQFGCMCFETNDLLRSSTNVFYCSDVNCSALHAIHLPRRKKRVLADTGLFLE